MSKNTSNIKALTAAEIGHYLIGAIDGHSIGADRFMPDGSIEFVEISCIYTIMDRAGTDRAVIEIGTEYGTCYQITIEKK